MIHEATYQKRWFSISRLLLLTAVIGCWLAYGVTRQRNASLKTRLQSLQKLSGELAVIDATQVVAIQSPPTWWQDQRWDVYLPESQTFKLRFYCGELESKKIPDPDDEISLPSGRHRIELVETKDDEQLAVVILVDGIERMQGSFPNSPFNSSTESQGVGRDQKTWNSESTQPFVLTRKRHVPNSRNNTPVASSAMTVLLWIDR